MIAHAIITTRLFDNMSITVIMLNSLVMMSEDPSAQDPPAFYKEVDNIFLILYSAEMILKIMGYGLIFAPNAYLKDAWNILDFVIVISGYLTLISEQQLQ
mmetsp:Transcript_20718/g.31777  ORF Transcript_20718/g.31777 Transcript_20718/m.31777 type:complete len:100 (-) Transcript_20718:387-686(-)